MNRVIPLIAIVMAATACTTPVSTLTRPDAYYDTLPNDDAADSLFAGDDAVLSDDEIANILAFQYSPPRLGRIALMPFGREMWSGWSEELAVASDQLQQDVIQTLLSSPAIYDAAYLPSILIPEQKTVPHLREAAARYQADLLLVYRSYCRSFERYRLFSADRSRAYCGVEAILLDTRTGLVPFTSSVMKSFEVAEDDADFSFRETMLRAQLRATTEALGDVSSEIVGFLEKE